METNYNKVFECLVGEDISIEDIPVTGMIAYALYKADKVKFILSHRNKNNGNYPPKEKIDSYCESLCTGKHLENYKEVANKTIEIWLNKVFQEKITKRENELKEQSYKSLEDVLKNNLPKYKDEWEGSLKKRTRFRIGIFQSVIGSAIFFLITAIILIGWGITNDHAVVISRDGINFTTTELIKKSQPQIP